MNHHIDLMSVENMRFEIWNEPNSGLSEYPHPRESFWPYPLPYTYEKHFMDTWECAYNAIKLVDSDAVVVGPEFSGNFINDLVNHFLLEAQSRGVVPDIISWHYPKSGAPHQADEIRNFLNEHGIEVDGVSIGEYVQGTENEHAGPVAYAIASIERANIPTAIHAASEKMQGAMDGTVTGSPTNGIKAKGSWYVYKTYSEMFGNIIPSSRINDDENDIRIESLASLQAIALKYSTATESSTNFPAYQANILLGARKALPSGGLDLEIDFGNYVRPDTTSIKIYRIPSNYEDGIDGPVKIQDESWSYVKTSFHLDWEDYKEAYHIFVIYYTQF